MKFLTNWTINLDKLPAYVEFNQDFKEEVDYHLANLILNYNDEERLTDEMKNEFRKLVERINPVTSMLSVRYSPRFKMGRRYADCPDELYPNGNPNPAFKKYYSALIAQPRLIKNTIFHYQGWVDIDQQKGHATLLLNIAQKNNIDLPAYKSYLAEGNFDKIVAELSAYYSVEGETDVIDKKDIKWLFNKTIYGGGHKKWTEDILTGSFKDHMGKSICKRKPKEVKNISKPHPFYSAFYEDTKKIIDLVYYNNQEIRKIVCKDIGGGEESDWKRKNRVMSYFCGIIENEITFKAYKYLESNHIIQKGFCDWGYDGLTFPFPSAYTDFHFHLNEMNDYVRKQTKLELITFVQKPFDDCDVLMPLIEQRRQLVTANNVYPVIEVEGDIDVETQSDNNNDEFIEGVIEDDNDGASLIYEKIKDRFKFCGGNIYFKQNNVWINSKKTVDNHLIHFILTKTNLQKMTEGKKPKPKPYSTNISGAKALREALCSKVIVEGEDNTLLQKFTTTTRGRLCFLDGVLDMTYKNEIVIKNKKKQITKKGKFYKWDEIDFEYYTPVQIKRNFAEFFENPNFIICNHIEKQIFQNLFGQDYKKALEFFARGVAGHFEDKAWSLYIGNRNCGKGVVDTLAKSALGEYHANVDAQNLLCSKSGFLKQEQAEKQMAFALDFQFARLTFSQELPPPDKNKNMKMNSVMIKKLVSGGDPLKAKRNYDIFITEFINMARLIVMANDCPTFTNSDALQTCCEFNSTISFKTQEEIDELVSSGEDEIILQQYKVGDPYIKDKCKTDLWANAFIMLMVMYYQDCAVSCVNTSEKNDDKDEDTTTSLRKFIVKTFEITKSSNDFLTNEIIRSAFEEMDYGDISQKKITIEMKAIGLKCDKKSGNRGVFGIKLRPSPTPLDDEGNEILAS